jgi:asparagine synthase (glutamine-hydrolysing)
MCGICGIVDWRGRPIDEGRLIRMRDLMTARGPDRAGSHVEPGVALGHRRLRVIDLSEAADQPLANEDQSVWIVFNGEVYNFQELRAELLSAGHRFGSSGDSEVLVHGYEQWGLEALARRMKGMFAAAIWDAKASSLHLLRDPLGKKPLFFRLSGGRLWFASSIQGVREGCEDALAVDEQAVDEFLYYSYISSRRSIYRGVSKLPPGHWATFDSRGVRMGQYWRPDYSRKQARTEREWMEGIDHYLGQAVRRRLIADVPLGAFLSGGVDSSTVCALMARESDRPVRTFTIGFDSREFDERRYSRQVARHIGSQHTELLVEPDIASELSRIVWHYGEPYGDSSMIPTYLIAREARRELTVVLSGDGGDEVFAGYSRHRRADHGRKYGWAGRAAAASLGSLLARACTALAPRRLFSKNLDQFIRYVKADRSVLAMGTCWFDGLREGLYTQGLRARLGGWHPLADQRELLAGLTGPTFADQALEYLLRTVLVDDYLVKVDVATMAHALELRCAFLDIDLLDFAMGIPASVLLKGHQAKALLKRYAEGLIPPEVIYRKKHGFSIPLKQWFRTSWREPVRRLLLSGPARQRGLFEPAAVGRLLDQHAAGRANHAARIWTLMVLEIWHRLFVDRTLRPGEPVLEG